MLDIAFVGSICVIVLHAAGKDPEMQCAFLGLHLLAGVSLILRGVLRLTIFLVLEWIHWFGEALVQAGMVRRIRWLYKTGNKVKAFRNCLVVFVNRHFPR